MAGKTYKQIKIVGFILFIPLILCAGPLAGYFTGDYLARRFNWPSYVSLLAAAVGFAASVKETVRIIRVALKIDRTS